MGRGVSLIYSTDNEAAHLLPKQYASHCYGHKQRKKKTTTQTGGGSSLESGLNKMIAKEIVAWAK